MMPLDLNQLTEAERDAILSVIKRDEDLKQKDGDRVRKLKAEIKQLRLKGVLKDGQDSETTCARCREKFGFFSNKGAICPNCSHKVCDKCQVRDTEKHSFLCILCSKQKELDGMSNTWFYSKFRASKRKPKSKGVLTGTELVKSSITNTPIQEDEPESCQPSPRSMRALSPDNRSPSLSHREMNGGRSRSPSPSTRSQGDPSPVTSDAGGLEEEGSAGASLDNPPPLAANPCVVVLNDGRPASSGDGDSSSDSHVTLVAVEDETKDLQSCAVDRSVNNQSPWEHLEQDAAHLMVPPEESNDGSYKEESKEGCTEKEEEEDLLLAYRKAAIPLQMMINEIENDGDEDSLSVISERTEPDDNFEIVDLNYVSCEQDAKPDVDVVANEQLSIQSAAEIPFEVVPPVGEIQVEKSVEESSTIPSENPENKKQEKKKEQTEEMTEETRERTISEISLDSANMKRRDTLGTLASSQDSLNMPTSDLDDDLDVILEQNKDFVSEAELQDIMREIAERNETANGSMSKQVIEELKLHLQNRAAAAAATAAAAVTTEEERSIEDEDEETEDGAVDDTPISPINDLQKMFDKPPKYFGSATQPIPIAKHLDSVEYQPDEKKTPEEEVHVQKEVTVTNFDEGPVLTSTVTESVCMQVMQNVEEAEPEVDQAVLLPLKDERVKAGNEDAATDDALQDEAEKSSPDEETEEVVTDDVVQDKTNESEPGEETVESVEEKERESLTNEVHAVIVTAEEVEREKVEVVIESESPEPTSSSPVTPPAGFKDSLNSISASEQEKKENEEEERGEQPMEETLGSVKTCSFETLYQAEATAEEEAQDEAHLEANGFLAPPSPARSRADTEDATDSKSVEKEPIRSAESPVPSIAVTCPEKSSLHSEKDDNIDEAFAEQTPENASNLLSPHSMSRESLASFYSDAGDGVHGKIPVSGEIQFALEYNYKLGQFEVHVKSCRDLAPADSKKKRSDPYVKTYLLPDKSKTGKRKTKVKKHSLSPCFDETLKYQLTKSELETRTLWLTVWSYGNFGRNDFLGEVTIPLDYYHFTDTTPRWHKLLERQLPCMETTSQMENPAVSTLAYKGDLEVALKYISPENIPKDKSKKSKESRGELQVMIKGARNLTAVRANGFSDSFCKGYLLPEKSSRVKKKTPVIKKNVNPLWNHNFIFENLPWEDLKDRCLELTVWDHDRLTSNDFLGGVRLSLGTGNSADKEVDWMDSTGKEISIWQRMLDSPNYWIEDTLSLRPSMSGKHHKPR